MVKCKGKQEGRDRGSEGVRERVKRGGGEKAVWRRKGESKLTELDRSEKERKEHGVSFPLPHRP